MKDIPLERGVYYSPTLKEYSVGRNYFPWAELANIFAYMHVQFDDTFAEMIVARVKKRFQFAGVAWDVASNSGKSVADFILSAAPRIGGDTAMKLMISQTPNDTDNRYHPQRDTSEYIEYLILSWCAAPKYQPRYHFVQPGSIKRGY
jgi:hypothetical protein